MQTDKDFHIGQLVAARLRGELTVEQERELENWMSESGG